METGEWTIEELAEHVAGALADGYPGQPSGRVREVPDRRTIRWYTTIGLVDRPAATRGRTALYGRRHLLQLVAVKRLQAQGRTIAGVQEELLGADDATLERIAALPAAAPRPRFWAAPPAPPAPESPAPPAAESPATSLVPAVRLGAGATLLLDAGRTPTADELAAIRAAAGPLLDLLHRLHLAKGTS
jgi:DNA-binding transcriptional MerR regulator